MFAAAVGDGSLNGNVVVPKAMRWWFVSVCLPAALTRGDTEVESRVEGKDGLWRCFWMAEDERRLEVRKRRWRWRVRTAQCQLCLMMMGYACLLSARMELISESSCSSWGSGVGWFIVLELKNMSVL